MSFWGCAYILPSGRLWVRDISFRCATSKKTAVRAISQRDITALWFRDSCHTAQRSPHRDLLCGQTLHPSGRHDNRSGGGFRSRRRCAELFLDGKRRQTDRSRDTATFDATGLTPGKYTVGVTVKDKKQHPASCSSEITVLKRNHAPTASVEPGTFSLTQGESASLRCIAKDPDNDPLTYAWSVDGQKLAATGPRSPLVSEGANRAAILLPATQVMVRSPQAAARRNRSRKNHSQPAAFH